MNQIEFHFHQVNHPSFFKRTALKKWIKTTLKQLTNSKLGELSFVFCSDSYLLKINQDYLNHDTLTDIITFNYNSDNRVSGEVYISLERVEENANELKIDYEHELNRVIIHGVLHLIGIDDKTPSDKAIMRDKEDYCLNLWSKI